MPRIRIPRVAVSRELATSLVKSAVSKGGQPGFEVDGRGLVINNDSFAYQLAKDIKAANGASVSILGGSPKWNTDFETAAAAFDLKIERV